MSDPDASPFRRFPWAALVFCLACLAMTAWTWMRTGERPAPQRHREHRGRREHWVAVLCDLCVSVVKFDVDGIVVGAMGCFPTQSVGPKSGANAPGIFGLYLRRWLRERKAAA